MNKATNSLLLSRQDQTRMSGKVVKPRLILRQRLKIMCPDIESATIIIVGPDLESTTIRDVGPDLEFVTI